jgi:hypothetical protein
MMNPPQVLRKKESRRQARRPLGRRRVESAVGLLGGLKGRRACSNATLSIFNPALVKLEKQYKFNQWMAEM